MRHGFLLFLLVVVAVADSQAVMARSSGDRSSQGAQVADHPFAGNWIANLSKSRQHPDYRFTSATLEIAVAENSVRMASRVVGPSGREQQAAETFKTDGSESAGTLTPGVVHVARWLDPHVLATIAKKDGKVFALATYEVSADRKTLTVRTSGTIDQVVVFERQ